MKLVQTSLHLHKTALNMKQLIQYKFKRTKNITSALQKSFKRATVVLKTTVHF